MKVPGNWTNVLMGAVLAGALAGAAGAQEADKPLAAGPALRPLLGLGLTVGGDPILVPYAEPDAPDVVTREDYIKFGQFWQFYGGVEYQVAPRFSLQATLGYHTDSSSDYGTVVRFSRYPLELLGHYHATPEWRFGGGLRYVKNARFLGDVTLSEGGNSNFRFDFQDTTGLVLETEYRMSRSLGLKFRLVAEKYELEAPLDGDKVDGSHAGLMLNWYLF
jgi:opacity protein-like surface antigen